MKKQMISLGLMLVVILFFSSNMLYGSEMDCSDFERIGLKCPTPSGNAPAQDKQGASAAAASNPCAPELDEAEDKAAACTRAADESLSNCGLIDFSASAAALIPQVTAGVSEGDMNKACKASRALNAAGVAANTTFYLTCNSRAGTCLSSCGEDIANIIKRQKVICEGKLISQRTIDPGISQLMNNTVNEIADLRTKVLSKESQCRQDKAKSSQAALAAVQNAAGLYQSQACIKAIAATECKTQEDLRTKPECRFQMCAPGSQWAGTTDCAGFYALNCEAPENFGNQVCICRANPTDPQCPGVAQNTDPNNPFGPGGGPGSGPRFGDNDNPNGNGPGGDPFAPGFTDDQLASLLADNDPSNDEFARNALANRNGGGAGGGGTPGSGLQTSPFNPNTAGGRGGGQGRGPYDTNILGAADRDKGSFPSGGGGGAYPFGGGDGKGQSMNLKDFLPGGKGAARAIASQKELEKNGVSDANGLTNFQKVTRKMNDLRAKEQVLKDGP